jgi:hypothetical protein
MDEPRFRLAQRVKKFDHIQPFLRIWHDRTRLRPQLQAGEVERIAPRNRNDKHALS